MTDIAYQNKDIASKVTGEALVGKTLAVFGLPQLKVVDVLPTNLPAVESNELRLDNLFLPDDGSVAIIDYEPQFVREAADLIGRDVALVGKWYQEWDGEQSKP